MYICMYVDDYVCVCVFAFVAHIRKKRRVKLVLMSSILKYTYIYMSIHI